MKLYSIIIILCLPAARVCNHEEYIWGDGHTHASSMLCVKFNVKRFGYEAAHTNEKGVVTATNVIMPPCPQGTMTEHIWNVYLELG